MQSFHSNGKLMISGEYVVLNGAKSLALPTQMGQTLQVETLSDTPEIIINWNAYNHLNQLWFSTTINLSTSKIVESTHSQVSDTLLRIFNYKEVFQKLQSLSHSYNITTHLQFDKELGLGTSSTLIYNIAQWLQVNPYKLNQYIFKGSGYDIACAKHNTPIIYQISNKQPLITKAKLSPNITKDLYFIYLNKKQNSKKSIQAYQKKTISQFLVEEITTLTEEFIQAQTIKEFQKIIKTHQNLLSQELQLPNIQEEFSDFNGEIKNLGAWGGDFILAATEVSPYPYFQSRGYKRVIKYSGIIK